MANEWRLFRSRYAGLFNDISRQHPAFWTELGDVLERRHQRQFTTEGAQVREFPDTRELGVQTERTWSVDQILNEVFGRAPTEVEESGTQTSTTAVRDIGMQTLPIPQITSGTQASPDRCTRETETSYPQRTVGTQVEITTGNLAGPPNALGSPIIPRGRGRGLRPILPNERIQIGSRGPTPPREPFPLPREAPPPSLPREGSSRRATRGSPDRYRSTRRTPERRGRSSTRRTSRDTSRERSQPRGVPAGKNEKRLTDRSSSRGPSLPVAPTRVATVCWNCRAIDHRYSTCPLPRNHTYCYGCGRRGVTMRTCPTCGEEWRNLGPYRPEQGHLGNRDLPFP